MSLPWSIYLHTTAEERLPALFKCWHSKGVKSGSDKRMFWIVQRGMG